MVGPFIGTPMYVHVPQLLLRLVTMKARRQQEHLDDVRCPVCQAAPEMRHAAGWACDQQGRWFGTRAERHALRQALAVESADLT